jgi:hypothetical protein
MMRHFLGLMVCAVAIGQTQTERRQVVNGRAVPVEQTTERVVRTSPDGSKVVERITQAFDAAGRPAGITKILVEETPLAGGGSTVKETVSQRDVNGGFKEMERKVTEMRVKGQTSTTATTVERPGLNHGFQTVERRNVVTSGVGGTRQQSTETVERVDVGGRFQTVERTESNVQKAGASTKEDAAVYALDATGRLRLTKQVVTNTTTQADGSANVESTLYGVDAPGKATSSTSGMQLLEQKVAERVVGKDGVVREAVSVRLASGSTAGKLGPLTKIGETVCAGKCLPEKVPEKPKAEEKATAKARN